MTGDLLIHPDNRLSDALTLAGESLEVKPRTDGKGNVKIIPVKHNLVRIEIDGCPICFKGANNQVGKCKGGENEDDMLWKMCEHKGMYTLMSAKPGPDGKKMCMTLDHGSQSVVAKECKDKDKTQRFWVVPAKAFNADEECVEEDSSTESVEPVMSNQKTVEDIFRNLFNNTRMNVKDLRGPKDFFEDCEQGGSGFGSKPVPSSPPAPQPMQTQPMPVQQMPVQYVPMPIPGQGSTDQCAEGGYGGGQWGQWGQWGQGGHGSQGNNGNNAGNGNNGNNSSSNNGSSQNGTLYYPYNLPMPYYPPGYVQPAQTYPSYTTMPESTTHAPSVEYRTVTVVSVNEKTITQTQTITALATVTKTINTPQSTVLQACAATNPPVPSTGSNDNCANQDPFAKIAKSVVKLSNKNEINRQKCLREANAASKNNAYSHEKTVCNEELNNKLTREVMSQMSSKANCLKGQSGLDACNCLPAGLSPQSKQVCNPDDLSHSSGGSSSPTTSIGSASSTSTDHCNDSNGSNGHTTVPAVIVGQGSAPNPPVNQSTVPPSSAVICTIPPPPTVGSGISGPSTSGPVQVAVSPTPITIVPPPPTSSVLPATVAPSQPNTSGHPDDCSTGSGGIQSSSPHSSSNSTDCDTGLSGSFSNKSINLCAPRHEDSDLNDSTGLEGICDDNHVQNIGGLAFEFTDNDKKSTEDCSLHDLLNYDACKDLNEELDRMNQVKENAKAKQEECDAMNNMFSPYNGCVQVFEDSNGRFYIKGPMPACKSNTFSIRCR